MNYLVIAAHPDDEILGCGGSIARWSSEGNNVHIIIMAEGETSRDKLRNTSKKKEQLNSLKRAAIKASKEVGAASVEFHNFPDNRMDSVDLLEVIKIIEQKVSDIEPTVVITHHIGDLNIDHSVIHKAVLTACRPEMNQSVKKIMSFEINSSTEWNTPSMNDFSPNLFIDISNFIQHKLNALAYYESEMKEEPHPRSIEGVRALAKLRGYSVGLEFAESFMILRQIE